MPRIRILDEDTVSKIAAGEVIERPSSVVKELVENSIDAEATKILIEVANGGLSLIRVTDDGCGIDYEELPLAFQKHATSKISVAQDLFSVRTLGFRGEALSSIANVARSIEVYTKTKGSLIGTFMRIENGKAVEIKKTGCPTGTSIAVKDLFYNMPARRKHLKSPETELAHITYLLTEMAIINYDASLELFSGNRTFFKSVRSKTWDDVLLRIFGLNAVKQLATFYAESDQWTLKGVAGDPLATRSSPDRIFFYINGRAVNSRIITAALRDSYRSIIPTGRYPIAVVSLQINPELMDVNIHPTKREIRLFSEEEISMALTHAVSSALRDRSIAKTEVAAPIAQPMDRIPAEIACSSEQLQLSTGLTEDETKLIVGYENLSRTEVLGQIFDLYILAKCEEGLILVDQHAAAERIRFERLLEKYRTKTISQDLVEPIILELDPNERILMDSWQGELKELGFDILPFGGNAWYVRAVPAIGQKLESAAIVHDILRDLFTFGKVNVDTINKEDILKILACRESIKSGYRMTSAEMSFMLKELFSCQNPLTCPHGRPIAVILRPEQFEKLFHRR
ncbi:MAG: DNA mismatch repair endonuclease MutL [Methanotrichaceae archaeon]|nr:DNA mismatch repair endonuclease MutL [Methanotrichaceae archaeon]